MRWHSSLSSFAKYQGAFTSPFLDGEPICDIFFPHRISYRVFIIGTYSPSFNFLRFYRKQPIDVHSSYHRFCLHQYEAPLLRDSKNHSWFGISASMLTEILPVKQSKLLAVWILEIRRLYWKLLKDNNYIIGLLDADCGQAGHVIKSMNIDQGTKAESNSIGCGLFFKWLSIFVDVLRY